MIYVLIFSICAGEIYPVRVHAIRICLNQKQSWNNTIPIPRYAFDLVFSFYFYENGMTETIDFTFMF